MTTVEALHRPVRSGTAAISAETSAGISAGLRLFCVVAIVVGIAAALYFYGHRTSLWEDELIAVTHANQPLPLFFIEILRNDLHPPLYFLQLDGWLALGSDSDRWVLANSLAWAAISLVAVFFVTRAVHGPRAAWLATTLFAVLPNFIWSAGTLRMYAALPACVLFAYYANRHWFETRRARWLLFALLTEVVLAYTHAVEFFFVAFIVFGALVEAGVAGRLRRSTARFVESLPMWLLVQIVFGVLVLPLAMSALVRGSDASAPDSIVAMLTVGGSLFAGWKTSSIVWVRVGGSILFLVLVAAALVDRGSRARTLAIPLAALAVALIVGLVVKPIFKQPVFAANLLPFIVLGAVAASRSRAGTVVIATCIVVLAVVAFPLALRQAQPEGYADAARWVRDRAKPGDVVVVPNVSVFWGVMRYAVGPDWGRPLAVMPTPNAEWARLNDKLARLFGPDVPKRLGLVPERNDVVRDGVRYVLGSDAVAETRDAAHVWLVKRERYKTDIQVDPRFRPAELAPATFGDGELRIERLDAARSP